MNILIVNPYRLEKPDKDKEMLYRQTQLWDDENLMDYGGYPLEVPYMGAILRKGGHKVTFIDAHASKITPSCIEYQGFDWVIVGTAPYGKWRCAQFSCKHAINTLLKARKEGCKTIVYGPHCTVTPDQFAPYADHVIRGEPEGLLLRALKSCEKIIELKEEELTNNLDDWTPLAHDLIDFSSGHYDAKYIFEGQVTGRLGTLSGSRGCPYPCSFCFKVMIPEKIRFHSPRMFLKIAEDLVSNYNCKALNINDLTFTLNKKWVLEVCEGLKKIDIPYSCGTRCDRLDSEIVDALAGSGCFKIDLGVESASDSLLNNLNKRHKWSDSVDAINLCKKRGIPLVRAFQMFFVPGETRSSVKETFKKFYDLNMEVTPAICTPYPTTGLWKKGVEEGKLKNSYESWEEISDDIILTAGTIGNSFNRKELGQILNLESFTLKNLRFKLVNEYKKNGLKGVLKKGTILIKRVSGYL